MRVCVVIKDFADIMLASPSSSDSRLLANANKNLKDIPYKKGKKYYYSTAQRTYFIYKMETEEYLFGVDEKEFQEYFIDLEDYREDTINDLLK